MVRKALPYLMLSLAAHAVLLGLLLAAWLANWITRRILLKVVARVAQASPLQWDDALMARVIECLQYEGVEYRRGTAGGGNQLRQPYARARWGEFYELFPQAEHIHQYGLYLGNYPTLKQELIVDLCERLNKL